MKGSNSSYRLKWFCILKKDGKSLQIIHYLQPLNAVTVKDSGMPPILESFMQRIWVAEGPIQGLTSSLPLITVSLAVQFQDLTTFQMPLSLLCLTTLPMGALNSLQILQGDISFIIQEVMPDIAASFMDNLNIRGAPNSL